MIELVTGTVGVVILLTFVIVFVSVCMLQFKEYLIEKTVNQLKNNPDQTERQEKLLKIHTERLHRAFNHTEKSFLIMLKISFLLFIWGTIAAFFIPFFTPNHISLNTLVFFICIGGLPLVVYVYRDYVNT